VFVCVPDKQIALDKLDEMQSAEWLIGEQTQSEVRIEGLNPKVKVEFALTRISGSCASTPDLCAGLASILILALQLNSAVSPLTLSEASLFIVPKLRVDADVKLNWISITFVFISYLGTWIAPAAAPARVALGIITILTVSGYALRPSSFKNA
jgi:hypothetical protein